VQSRKIDLHLDDRTHCRACGGQNINAISTDVPCGSFTLEVITARPLPTENYRDSHSMANGLPPFDRMLSCFCDVRVSTFDSHPLTTFQERMRLDAAARFPSEDRPERASHL
jgi:hypothetical protein